MKTAAICSIFPKSQPLILCSATLPVHPAGCGLNALSLHHTTGDLPLARSWGQNPRSRVTQLSTVQFKPPGTRIYILILEDASICPSTYQPTHLAICQSTQPISPECPCMPGTVSGRGTQP